MKTHPVHSVNIRTSPLFVRQLAEEGLGVSKLVFWIQGILLEIAFQNWWTCFSLTDSTVIGFLCPELRALQL